MTLYSMTRPDDGLLFALLFYTLFIPFFLLVPWTGTIDVTVLVLCVLTKRPDSLISIYMTVLHRQRASSSAVR